MWINWILGSKMNSILKSEYVPLKEKKKKIPNETKMKVFNKSESRWRGCLTLRTRQPALWQPSWHVWSSAHSDRTLLSLWPKPKIPWLPFTVSMTYIRPFSLRSCHSIACTDGHSNTLLQHTITTYHAAILPFLCSLSKFKMKYILFASCIH